MGMALLPQPVSWGAEGKGWVIYSGIGLGLGFVVRITLSVLSASNSSSATFCLEWELVCPECFLNVLAPPSALGFLSPETLFPRDSPHSLAPPLGNCCCFYLLAGNREVLHYPGSVSGKPCISGSQGLGFLPVVGKLKVLNPEQFPPLLSRFMGFFFSFHSS